MIKQKKKRRKPIDERKKNLRRLNCLVTAQTMWHIDSICAANGWGEKDRGRAVDKMTIAFVTTRGEL